MSDFNDTIAIILKDRCYTVEELIEKLKQYPPETKIASDGADSGGYDTIAHGFVIPHVTKDYVMLNHMEARAYQLVRLDTSLREDFDKIYRYD